MRDPPRSRRGIVPPESVGGPAVEPVRPNVVGQVDVLRSLPTFQSVGMQSEVRHPRPHPFVERQSRRHSFERAIETQRLPVGAMRRTRLDWRQSYRRVCKYAGLFQVVGHAAPTQHFSKIPIRIEIRFRVFLGGKPQLVVSVLSQSIDWEFSTHSSSSRFIAESRNLLMGRSRIR